MTDALKLTGSETVSVRRRTDEALEVEATYGPEGKPPPAHLHPGQAERFEVLAGELTARVEGRERRLRAGDTLEIPIAAPHQMWNAGAQEARVLWRTMPAGRTLDWFQSIDRLHREGRVGRNGMPGPLPMAALLSEYRDVFQLDARPRALVRGALAGLGALARLTGRAPR